MADSADVVVFRADFYADKQGVYIPCAYGLQERMLPTQRPFAGIDVKKDVFKTVVGWAWDKLFRTEFIAENGIVFQEQRTSNDLLFVFSAFVKADRITTLSEVLVHQRRQASGSLSVTRERSWSCFYDALIALRNQLASWGLYQRFEQDYINYALHFCLWNLNTLKEPTREKLFLQLKNEWFQELDISAYPREKFYNRCEYAQFEMIMKYSQVPFFYAPISFFYRCTSWIKKVFNT